MKNPDNQHVTQIMFSFENAPDAWDTPIETTHGLWKTLKAFPPFALREISEGTTQDASYKDGDKQGVYMLRVPGNGG
jgi:hypothetical protein